MGSSNLICSFSNLLINEGEEAVQVFLTMNISIPSCILHHNDLYFLRTLPVYGKIKNEFVPDNTPSEKYKLNIIEEQFAEDVIEDSKEISYKNMVDLANHGELFINARQNLESNWEEVAFHRTCFGNINTKQDKEKWLSNMNKESEPVSIRSIFIRKDIWDGILSLKAFDDYRMKIREKAKANFDDICQLPKNEVLGRIYAFDSFTLAKYLSRGHRTLSGKSNINYVRKKLLRDYEKSNFLKSQVQNAINVLADTLFVEVFLMNALKMWTPKTIYSQEEDLKLQSEFNSLISVVIDKKQLKQQKSEYD